MSKIHSIEFKAKPDYEGLRKQLISILEQNHFRFDDEYDWNTSVDFDEKFNKFKEKCTNSEEVDKKILQEKFRDLSK